MVPHRFRQDRILARLVVCHRIALPLLDSVNVEQRLDVAWAMKRKDQDRVSAGMKKAPARGAGAGSGTAPEGAARCLSR
ncbi:hypothetical protein MOX02_10180 [Methylobacterium oxalidis]|uniref:Uncharacterized protein n=1 Tax=Methylobacterium oxalidis TaxID=944322 RepID=A0A512IZ48_9HYPH|nr:hypothetical protein MOX02_10180 [Methylobacterium oxalidis]